MCGDGRDAGGMRKMIFANVLMVLVIYWYAYIHVFQYYTVVVINILHCMFECADEDTSTAWKCKFLFSIAFSVYAENFLEILSNFVFNYFTTVTLTKRCHVCIPVSTMSRFSDGQVLTLCGRKLYMKGQKLEVMINAVV